MLKLPRLWLALAWLSISAGLAGAETIRIATFNVENYLDRPAEHRPAKTAAGKAKVCQSILALKPDVLALQEMGATNVLLELRAALKGGGLDLPFWEHVSGYDTNLHLAILSRFPFTARQPHTNAAFLLAGRLLRVTRGFAEVEVQVNAACKFTLLAAHLKSRRPSPQADEAEWREQEALALRSIIDRKLEEDADLPLVVLGDFNDTKDSRAVRAVIGRGKTALFDTSPAERQGQEQGDDQPATARKDQTNAAERTPRRPRRTSWTHYYSPQDVYRRVDYILISRTMKALWLPEETYVLNLPDWGAASDHRPLVAAFLAGTGDNAQKRDKAKRKPGAP